MATTLKTENSKVGILLKLLGEQLPEEVLKKLSTKELEALMKKLDKVKSASTTEEKKVLREFESGLERIRKESDTEIKIKRELEKIIKENTSNLSLVTELRKKKYEDLKKIVQGEKPRLVSLVICFANPDEASHLFEDFSDKQREDVILEMHRIDLHDEIIKNELERFLAFKLDLIKESSNSAKVQNRNGWKIAEIFSRISPNLSLPLFQKISMKNPEFARQVDSHFYTFRDLEFLSRTSISKFFYNFHPIVVGSALKGIESSTREKLLDRCEPTLSRSIRLEMDSMGPISLAEIEEAQKAVTQELNILANSGEIKLWKVK